MCVCVWNNCVCSYRMSTSQHKARLRPCSSPNNANEVPSRGIVFTINARNDAIFTSVSHCSLHFCRAAALCLLQFVQFVRFLVSFLPKYEQIIIVKTPPHFLLLSFFSPQKFILLLPHFQFRSFRTGLCAALFLLDILFSRLSVCGTNKYEYLNTKFRLQTNLWVACVRFFSPKVCAKHKTKIKGKHCPEGGRNKNHEIIT